MAQPGPKAGAKGVEVEAMRTATSRTVEDPVTGLLSTQLASESINYRDAKDAWQPVDNTVTPRKDKAGKAAGWKNGANRFAATFPTALAEPGAGAVSVANAGDPAHSLSLSVVPEPAASAAAGSSSGGRIERHTVRQVMPSWRTKPSTLAPWWRIWAMAHQRARTVNDARAGARCSSTSVNVPAE